MHPEQKKIRALTKRIAALEEKHNGGSSDELDQLKAEKTALVLKVAANKKQRLVIELHPDLVEKIKKKASFCGITVTDLIKSLAERHLETIK